MTSIADGVAESVALSFSKLVFSLGIAILELGLSCSRAQDEIEYNAGNIVRERSNDE